MNYDQKIAKRNNKAQFVAKIGLGISFIISAGLWIDYLFFYDSTVGAFRLLYCFFSGLLGIVCALSLANKRLKTWLIVINCVIAFSFPILFLIAARLGF
ncbi:MAG: hypothetical protein LKJ03_00370 [Enterococcaceae bacterium]|jgi:hypothetical protein|nr:hypothetical protein [Enterococcaceae bacterium]MCI1919320.1 hypothetical protein [Enterococcaceae bacterium]